MSGSLVKSQQAGTWGLLRMPCAWHASRPWTHHVDTRVSQTGRRLSAFCRPWLRHWPTATTRRGGGITPGRTWGRWRRGSAWMTSTRRESARWAWVAGGGSVPPEPGLHQ